MEDFWPTHERIMITIIPGDDFVSHTQAEGEWRNSSERVTAIIREYNTILFLRLWREFDEISFIIRQTETDVLQLLLCINYYLVPLYSRACGWWTLLSNETHFNN
jgi:hypothetical protein